MLQGKKKEGDRHFFHCATTKQKEEEEGDNVAAVPFFVALRCNATSQEEEEGDGNCHRLLCATQRNKTRGRRRRR